MSSISQVFQSTRAAGRLAFMPFITAGDPDLEMTVDVIGELSRRKVDLIEVGFPYSDPIADGPVIQASYTRALNRKVHVEDIFTALKTAASKPGTPPLIAMVSYAIVHRRSAEDFVRRCNAAGLAGLIIPDLPGDEAGETYQLVRGAGLDLIQLIAPTTPPERARQIVKTCSGFLYCIAVAGTTGVREQVRTELTQQLQWLKKETDLPLAVGFGISKVEHLVPLKGLADGAIVGSGIVKHFESLADGNDRQAVVGQIGDFAAEMVAGTGR
jgi:tryptophan synthase alpha chain